MSPTTLKTLIMSPFIRLSSDKTKVGVLYLCNIVKVDAPTVRFEAIVNTTGWIAFGVNPKADGGMIGSDIITVWVDENGMPQYQVRYEYQTGICER